MNVHPVRLQLSRKRGFNLQELSRATNGLCSVNVARPSKWGNPFRVGAAFITGGNDKATISGALTAEQCVSRYRDIVTRIDTPADRLHFETRFNGFVPDLTEIVRNLRGKNLACWCEPGAPCHADVLLELANA